jgi:hypothetical protein
MEMAIASSFTLRRVFGSLAIALVVVGLGIFLDSRHYVTGGSKVTMIAEQSTWNIDPQQITCLTLNHRIANEIFGSDYTKDPKVLRALKRYFPAAKVESNNPDCPYIFSFNVIAHDHAAVRYRGHASQTLISLVVSSISDRGTTKSDRVWLEKNLFLFRSDLSPIVAFEVGLKAFLIHQKQEWQTIDVALPDNA